LPKEERRVTRDKKQANPGNKDLPMYCLKCWKNAPFEKMPSEEKKTLKERYRLEISKT
jgi:hypothetical protein